MLALFGSETQQGEILMNLKRTWLVMLALLVVGGGVMGADAEEADQDSVGADAKQSFEKKWFWILGTTNYHVKLDESEDDIDLQINTLLGTLMPGLDEPTTFKDWSDDWRVWDIWAGFGRDIHAKSSWSVYAGGGQGTIENNDFALLLGLIPIDTDIDFTRRSYFAGTSVSYYPWGRPVKPKGTQKGSGMVRHLKAARPVFEMNAGYNRQVRIANVKLNGPIFGRKLLGIRQKDKFDLLWASPRAAMEIPLTENDSLTFMTGYTFFHDHSEEYNSFLLQAFVRHRF